MQVVILAGGLGSRLSEETHLRPKPMVEIGGKPILWHIMKIYSAQGFNDFVICLGYKGYVIKEYFANYRLHNANVVIDFASDTTMELSQMKIEPWRVTLVDTGESTQIGGRIKRIIPFIKGDEFFLTYGDGVADVKLPELVALHHAEQRLATVTAAQPPGRYGAVTYQGNRVTGFQEKPLGDEGWINAGFFMLNRKVESYIADDSTVWEEEPMEQLAADNQLSVYFHYGFWRPMDTLRDNRQLNELYQTGKAPWKIWT